MINNRKLFQLAELISRTTAQQLLSKTHNGERDIYAIAGYPSASKLGFDHFAARFERQDIAGRIVDAPALATWRREPILNEDDDEENVTAFEEAWQQLVDKHRMYHWMERSDRLAGIGRYGVLLLGLQTASKLNQPIEEGSLTNLGSKALLYLRAFSEKRAEVKELEENISSNRFGLPKMYRVNFGTLESNQGELDIVDAWKDVHWSRIIHIAEGKLENEIFGEPRLKRVYNRLIDLEKVTAGGGEVYWQGSRMGIHADVDPEFALGDLAGDVDDKFTDVTAELDEFYNNFRRFIRTQGVTLQTLGTQVSDPTAFFEIFIDLISAASGIPQRVLMGSERGELASGQDETNWNARIKERQTVFAEPEMLRPTIERLQFVGVLPKVDSYVIDWPSLFELDEKAQAEIAKTKSEVIKNLSPGDPDKYVLEDEVRDWLALDPFTQEQLASLLEQPLDEADEQVQAQFRKVVG